MPWSDDEERGPRPQADLPFHPLPTVRPHKVVQFTLNQPFSLLFLVAV